MNAPLERVTEISEAILHAIDAYLEANIHIYIYPNFLDRIFNNVTDLMMITLADTPGFDETSLISLVLENIQYYLSTIGIPRSYKMSIILGSVDEDAITIQLDKLRNIIQPAQKSTEWYQLRHTMLTASSIWQALDSQSAQNRLIYKKCAPLNISKCFQVNISSPMHWGQKYEPISQQFYEHMYSTELEEFGCIQHQTHSEVGASPDGINNKKGNPRYGRLVEIKNIVNREITGIPKKEYWVQMQMQMEVMNLNECDFLETRFKEYDSEEEFLKEGGFDNCEKFKGVIIQFSARGGPVYNYSPFVADKEVIDAWISKSLDENETMTWIRNIYWSLEEYSCVLVTRNRKWFAGALPQFQKIWKTILYERVNGFAHRKPKKKQKSKSTANIILKIRTESFDHADLTPQEVAQP